MARTKRTPTRSAPPRSTSQRGGIRRGGRETRGRGRGSQLEVRQFRVEKALREEIESLKTQLDGAKGELKQARSELEEERKVRLAAEAAEKCAKECLSNELRGQRARKRDSLRRNVRYQESSKEIASMALQLKITLPKGDQLEDEGTEAHQTAEGVGRGLVHQRQPDEGPSSQGCQRQPVEWPSVQAELQGPPNLARKKRCTPTKVIDANRSEHEALLQELELAQEAETQQKEERLSEMALYARNIERHKRRFDQAQEAVVRSLRMREYQRDHATPSDLLPEHEQQTNAKHLFELQYPAVESEPVPLSQESIAKEQAAEDFVDDCYGTFRTEGWIPADHRVYWRTHIRLNLIKGVIRCRKLGLKVPFHIYSALLETHDGSPSYVMSELEWELDNAN